MNNLPDNIKDIPLFLVIGRPRSGTTLIQTLLEAHPNVIIPPESQVVRQCYMRFKKVKKWQKEQLNQLVDFLYDDIKFREWKISRKELLNNLLDYPDPLDFGVIIRIIYFHYISVFPKKEILVFGDKNPTYSVNPEEILKIIPDVKIVHIVRDYRDHILSVQRVKLLNSNLALIANLWKNSQKKILSHIEKDPESIISFKYEDFVSNPEYYLKEVCKFLSIPFSQSILNYTQKEKEMKKEKAIVGNDVFHGNLFKPISARNVEMWKTKMTKRDTMLADYFVGKYAELSGYKRQFSSRTILGFLRAIPGNLYTQMFRFVNFLILLVPIKWRKIVRRKILLRNSNTFEDAIKQKV